MKYLMIALMMFATTVKAEDMPAYLKDAEITVKLKDGKEYKFSANEYKVVKRISLETLPTLVSQPVRSEIASEPKRDKNILSLGLVRSQSGFDYNVTSSTHTVETQYRYGLSLQYQNNIYKNYYLGGRVDTNSGVEINAGFGF